MGLLPHDYHAKSACWLFQRHMCAQFLQKLGGNRLSASLFSSSIQQRKNSFKINVPLGFLFFFSPPPLQDRSPPPALHPDVVCMTKKKCFNCLLVMGSVFKITMLIYSAFWSFLMSTCNCKTSIVFQTVPCFLLQFQASVGGYLFSQLLKGKAHAYKKMLKAAARETIHKAKKRMPEPRKLSSSFPTCSWHHE